MQDSREEHVNINVIDTNVFIEHLHHVKALLNAAGLIAVARAAIQELDGLKVQCYCLPLNQCSKGTSAVEELW